MEAIYATLLAESARATRARMVSEGRFSIAMESRQARTSTRREEIAAMIAKEPMTSRQIQEALGITRGTVSRALRQLEAAGDAEVVGIWTGPNVKSELWSAK